MKNQVILFTLFCFSYVACNNKTNQNESKIIESNDVEVIKISEAITKTNFDISPYLDTLKFVKLELTEESIIGYIQKLTVYKERIYILDTQTSSLFIFDIDGNYIFKIASIGQGPTEYIQLDFFDIDIANEQIVLTDLMGSWIMKYDLEGNFIYRNKIPFWVEGVAPNSNKGYVVYANFRDNKNTMGQEFNLIYLDSLMQTSKKYFPYDSQIIKNSNIKFNTPQGSVFYPFNEDIYFFIGYGNNIYKIGSDGIIPKYSFDFGDRPSKFNIPEHTSSAIDYLEREEINYLGGVQETDDILSFMSGKRTFPVYQGFYSKKTKKLIYSSIYYIEKDVQFETPVIATYKSFLITELSVNSLLNWKTETQNISFNNKFLQAKKSLTDELTIDDNPVLMFYNLKPF